MKLIASYNLLYTDWYVGEFYSKFLEHLKNTYNVEIEYVHLNELAKKYNVPTDYSNGLPSFFSPFNFLLINESNNKTFVHSWHDYAPAILDRGTGIENFDVVKFSCVSRLDQGIIDNYKGTAKIQPSIYLLENLSDFGFVENYKNSEKIYNKVYFNALCHGIRERYIDVLSNSERFTVKKKDKGGWLSKENYYKEMSQYKFGMNLDGVAKICYRDLECFGMGVLLIREFLNVLTYEPLEVDKHYVQLIDEDIKSKIMDGSQTNYIIQKLENGIDEIVSSGKYEYIINESKGWYERNCQPENQIKIMTSFLEDFEIFK
jgi:hypothetical protein